MVTAGVVRTILQSSQVWGPKGQYLVKTPNSVMGMANKHNEVSAMAKVAIKMFRAVLIPAKNLSFLANEQKSLDSH